MQISTKTIVSRRWHLRLFVQKSFQGKEAFVRNKHGLNGIALGSSSLLSKLFCAEENYPLFRDCLKFNRANKNQTVELNWTDHEMRANFFLSFLFWMFLFFQSAGNNNICIYMQMSNKKIALIFR